MTAEKARQALQNNREVKIMAFVSKPQFDYQLHERKNGSKFIKVLLYIFDADGYVEVGRINQSKSHWVDQGYGEIEDIYHELKHNANVTDLAVKINPGILNK